VSPTVVSMKCVIDQVYNKLLYKTDIRIGGTLLRIFMLVYLCAPTCMEWIAKNVLNIAELVGGSSTGSEETETSEEADVRRRRNREYMQHRRAANDTCTEKTGEKYKSSYSKCTSCHTSSFCTILRTIQSRHSFI